MRRWSLRVVAALAVSAGAIACSDNSRAEDAAGVRACALIQKAQTGSTREQVALIEDAVPLVQTALGPNAGPRGGADARWQPLAVDVAAARNSGEKLLHPDGMDVSSRDEARFIFSDAVRAAHTDCVGAAAYR